VAIKEKLQKSYDNDIPKQIGRKLLLRLRLTRLIPSGEQASDTPEKRPAMPADTGDRDGQYS
jgi:hypothetical protein